MILDYESRDEEHQEDREAFSARQSGTSAISILPSYHRIGRSVISRMSCGRADVRTLDHP
jgi:hypothetical protein